MAPPLACCALTMVKFPTKNGDDNDDDVATTTMTTTTTTDDDGWDSPTDLSLARCSAPGKD